MCKLKLRGSDDILVTAAAMYFVHELCEKPLAAIGSTTSEPLQDHPRHDDAPVRAPFQELPQAAAPVRPGMTVGAQLRLDRLRQHCHIGVGRHHEPVRSRM